MTGDPSFVDYFLTPDNSGYSAVNGILGRNAFAFLGTAIAGVIGSPYCGANANSTGAPAVMGAFGTPVAAHNNVRLFSTNVPADAFAVFLVSRDQAFVPNAGGSEGNLCVGGTIGRYVGPGQIQNANNAGEVTLNLDLSMVPLPTGFVSAVSGDTFHWTSWYRDLAMAGHSTSNFANGLSVTFL